MNVPTIPAVPYAKQRGATYFSNIPIPTDLRPLFPTSGGRQRTHIVASLGTSDRETATARAQQLAADWQREFTRLRSQPAVAPAPLAAPRAHSVPPPAGEHHYLAFRLSEVANRLTRSASSVYHRRFGVTGIEWGVMAVIGAEPDQPAVQVCRQLGLDRGTASRAVNSLLDKGLLAFAEVAGRGREKPLRLSFRGVELRNRILQVAHEREQVLTAVLLPGEEELLVDMLRRLAAQLDAVAAVA